MKAGKLDQKEFYWTREDGRTEQMCLAFAPVSVLVMLGVDPSDYRAGVKLSDSLVYSMAVGKPCEEMQKPFHTVEDDVNQDLTSIGVIYISMNVAATVLFIFFSAVAAAYIGE
mmetsp:Transcript_13059/g.24521  ORF Transcript_13059/g.24521 Transcript_13059/m.24521 type:complete len:113 (+) Transcript_13059:201-539(+)